ncbi:MAG: BMP family ABC transporter substrate-binding protein [Clostridia bacterium]|nr:BMP family ABC transporter substrate-binding protein [Clostridia bacterium]
MKKILCAVLAIAMLFSLVACGSGDTTSKTDAGSLDVKVGLICLHDENSTYDNNFIQALKEVQADLGLKDDQVLIKTNIGEDESCYNAAAELVDAGCDIIFADSFGHETYMIQAAKEFKDVQFCHATGTKSQTEALDNYHNAFASIYEGRFLAGVAAGMKLNEMIEAGKITADKAIIGYVGAFNYAEVVSGMTSFFLGARYICPSATMKVVYTNSWFDIAKEKESALNLINSGCALISQHADSEGAPKACEEKGVPNVAYNISTISMGPTTALISSKIDWSVYFKLAINAVVDGEKIPTDYCGTMKEGAVKLTELNEKAAAAGTQEKIDEIKAKLESGELKVFDTKSFKVDGKELTTYTADVVDEGDFKPETEAIEDGAFAESSKRSAPYFDIKYIDGISEL